MGFFVLRERGRNKDDLMYYRQCAGPTSTLLKGGEANNQHAASQQSDKICERAVVCLIILTIEKVDSWSPTTS